MIRLRELRLEKGIISQREFASLMDIPTSTYNYWENERMQMDYNTLIKLADYFNVSVDYLLGRDYVPTEIGKKIKPTRIWVSFQKKQILMINILRFIDSGNRADIVAYANGIAVCSEQ